jgi:hypothetical protein
MGDKWKVLRANSLVEICNAPTFETGKIFHNQFEMLGSNIIDDLSIEDPHHTKPIDGIYRLR